MNDAMQCTQTAFALDEAEAKLEAQAKRIAELEDAAPLCDKHKPNGGKRAVCLVCALQEQSAALSQISYLCGPPNEMECGPYDIHCDESAVVEQVRAQAKRIAELEAALKGLLHVAVPSAARWDIARAALAPKESNDG
jgi:hypothetical protein